MISWKSCYPKQPSFKWIEMVKQRFLCNDLEWSNWNNHLFQQIRFRFRGCLSKRDHEITSGLGKTVGFPQLRRLIQNPYFWGGGLPANWAMKKRTPGDSKWPFHPHDWPSLVAHKLIDYLASDCGKNFSDRRPAFKAVFPFATFRAPDGAYLWNKSFLRSLVGLYNGKVIDWHTVFAESRLPWLSRIASGPPHDLDAVAGLYNNRAALATGLSDPVRVEHIKSAYTSVIFITAHDARARHKVSLYKGTKTTNYPVSWGIISWFPWNIRIPSLANQLCIHRENSNIPVKLMNFLAMWKRGSIEIAIGQRGPMLKDASNKQTPHLIT